MNEVERVVTAMAEGVARSLGMEILEVRFILHSRRHDLRIVLDRQDRAVSVGDCAAFSRQLSGQMELNDPIPAAYNLEVSSPGFRRLIRIPADLPRFQNRRVKVRLNEAFQDRTVWIGVLSSESDPLIIGTDEIGEIQIPIDNVKQLNLHE